MTELILKEEVYAIMGAAMEVYKELGPGFLEAVYQEAMEIELKSRGIPFEAQKPLVVFYKGNALKKRYEPDIFCFDLIIVELKALDKLSTNEEAQLLNYLTATKVASVCSSILGPGVGWNGNVSYIDFLFSCFFVWFRGFSYFAV